MAPRRLIATLCILFGAAGVAFVFTMDAPAHLDLVLSFSIGAAAITGVGVVLLLRDIDLRPASSLPRSALQHYYEGDVEQALVAAERHLDPTAPAEAWNDWLCVVVAIGDYRRAVAEIERRFPDVTDENTVPPDSIRQIMRINFCEALITLGDDARAARLLAGMEGCATPIVRGGVALTRAWQAWLAGRGEEAERFALQVGEVEVEALGHLWSDEVWFAEAMALALTGKHAEATAMAESATGARQSSERNRLVVLGRIAKLAGDLPRAIAHLTAAADHAYRWQNADGLLLLGQCKEAVGDRAGAEVAYEMAMSRDPQSRFAVEAAAARQRLRAA